MTHRSCLAGVTVGDGLNVAVVGALNVSPESFYAGSVRTCGDDLLRAAEAMARAGAAFLDVGAMSTAPYLDRPDLRGTRRPTASARPWVSWRARSRFPSPPIRAAACPRARPSRRARGSSMT